MIIKFAIVWGVNQFLLQKKKIKAQNFKKQILEWL